MSAVLSTETHSTGWREYAPVAPTAPLPPARLEDDFYMLTRCGLTFWQCVRKLSSFYGLIPAAVYRQLHHYAPARGETLPRLTAVVAPDSPLPKLIGWRNLLWRLIDSILALFALWEDRHKHQVRVPPGWQFDKRIKNVLSRPLTRRAAPKWKKADWLL